MSIISGKRAWLISGLAIIVFIVFYKILMDEKPVDIPEENQIEYPSEITTPIPEISNESSKEHSVNTDNLDKVTTTTQDNNSQEFDCEKLTNFFLKIEDNHQQEFDQFLVKKGYWIETELVSSPDIIHYSIGDYKTYDQEALRQLAEQGDGKASMMYALKLQKEIDINQTSSQDSEIAGQPGPRVPSGEGGRARAGSKHHALPPRHGAVCRRQPRRRARTPHRGPRRGGRVPRYRAGQGNSRRAR